MSKLKRIENGLLFLTLLFLPTQLGRHFWPQFAYIYSLKIDYLSPTIYFWDLLVVFLVLIFILQKKSVNRIALNLWLLFILSQLFSLLPYLRQPLNLGPGLVRIEQYIMAGLFGVYIASAKWSLISAKLFWPLAISVLAESVIAIAQFIKEGTLGLWVLGERTFSISTPAIAKFDFQGLEFLRPYATFPHPNVLAAFMVIGTLLLRAIYNGPGRQERWIVTTVLLATLATFLTVSRVAILAGLGAWLIVLKGKWRVILIGLVLLSSPFLFTRFSAVFNFDNLSLLRREQLSGVALNLWLSHPFFGIGLNNFIPQAADQLLVGPSRFLQPVHNIFLLSLAETGILGLLGFLGLIGYPIVRLFKLRTLLLIWTTILFLGLFDHYFLTLPQGYRLLFLVWGISLSRFA